MRHNLVGSYTYFSRFVIDRVSLHSASLRVSACFCVRSFGYMIEHCSFSRIMCAFNLTYLGYVAGFSTKLYVLLMAP